jgi:hypothetical protein
MILSLLTALPIKAEKKESLLCQNDYDKMPFVYLHPKRGKVVVYRTPVSYSPTPDDLVCVSLKQFWVHRQVFPEKLTILVVRSDYRSALILQINITSNVLMIAPVSIPESEGQKPVSTIWTMFTDPMKRINEMVRLKSLPLVRKKDVKANRVSVSRGMLFYLATGKRM